MGSAFSRKVYPSDQHGEGGDIFLIHQPGGSLWLKREGEGIFRAKRGVEKALSIRSYEGKIEYFGRWTVTECLDIKYGGILRLHHPARPAWNFLATASPVSFKKTWLTEALRRDETAFFLARCLVSAPRADKPGGQSLFQERPEPQSLPNRTSRPSFSRVVIPHPVRDFQPTVTGIRWTSWLQVATLQLRKSEERV